jgi:hypothetical protein
MSTNPQDGAARPTSDSSKWPGSYGAPALRRDEALQQIRLRYFHSHSVQW